MLRTCEDVPLWAEGDGGERVGRGGGGGVPLNVYEHHTLSDPTLSYNNINCDRNWFVSFTESSPLLVGICKSYAVGLSIAKREAAMLARHSGAWHQCSPHFVVQKPTRTHRRKPC